MSYYSTTQQQQSNRRGPGRDRIITGAANNGGGLIRITSTGHGFATNNVVDIANVAGTVEANKTGWLVTNIDANNFDLQGSAFVNTYISGGFAHLQ